MPKLTAQQRYNLFIIAYTRWFGAVFAVVTILILCSDLPRLVRSKDVKLLAAELGGVAAFFALGLTIYLIGTVVQQRYRARFMNRIG